VKRFSYRINTQTRFTPGLRLGLSTANNEESLIDFNIGKVPSEVVRSLRLYSANEPVLWPDVEALKVVQRTSAWPNNYSMTYRFSPSTESEGSFRKLALECVLLHTAITANEVEEYSANMRKLEGAIRRKELRESLVINYKFGTDSPPSLKEVQLSHNRSLEATAYFGKQNWPQDLLLGIGNVEYTECADRTYFGFYALPRRLFGLFAIIEPRFENLEIEGGSFRVDPREELRPLDQQTRSFQDDRVESSGFGVIPLERRETLIVPLRIELRYDASISPISDIRESEGASQWHRDIMNARASRFRYKWAGATIEKLKSSFRKPEARGVTPTYLFGPSYEIAEITVAGKSLAVRSTPAVAAWFTEGGISGGSCPFLFVNDGGDEPSIIGRVLVGADNPALSRRELVELPSGTRSIILAEQEPEITVIDKLAVSDKYTGEEIALADRIEIGPDSAREFIIPHRFENNAVLGIQGHYHQLRFEGP
jgi:hypothetical protein